MATASDHHPVQIPPLPTLETECPESFQSPSKRPKTETLALNSLLSPSSSKGKSKIEDEKKEKDCCGICLSEEGIGIRGYIDSCDHYFCFVCIMEWSKVESLCPLCKRRFNTIIRPPKPGIFYSERVVNVPVRNQIFNGLGNATIGPPRYLEAQCTVCHGSSDESLLLLCDLCDSASHTYCVGLGITVPEGDWFCHDCNLSRIEHKESEADHNCDSSTNMGNCNGVRFAKEPVSIRDIVGESNVLGNERPFPRSQLPSSGVPETVVNSTAVTSTTITSSGVTSTQLGARTLHRCRNVQICIRALRENWNSFRTGSLNFSSNSHDKRNNVTLGDKLDQQKSAPFSSQQSTSQEDSSSSMLQNKRSYDVEKAWKMMNAAKSIGRKSGKKLSKNPITKVNPPKEADKSNFPINVSNRKQHVKMDKPKFGVKTNYRSCALEKNDDKYKYQMFEKANQKGVIIKNNNVSVVDDLPNASGFRELSSCRKGQMAVQVGNYRESCENIRKNILFDVPNVISTHAQRSPLIASDIYCAKQEVRASSSCNDQMGMVSSTLTERPSLIASEISSSKQKLYASSSSSSQKGLVKGPRDCEFLKADEAKSEIQSLVKLNLKILTKDDKLEVDTFKEVARHATHSILATCGLERLKVGMRSFPGSFCHHGEEMLQLRRSKLMPTSCRECFFAFVKDVVSTILLERKGNLVV